MRVTVIPEGPRDKELLKPIVAAMMSQAGKPRAKVWICDNPPPMGFAESTRWDRLRTILDRWVGRTDLFLLVVDRDGEKNSGRHDMLLALEEQAAGVLPEGKALLGELAIEEVEVWVLAGHNLPSEWRWRDVRAEPHPKEAYFARFIGEHLGMSDDAAGRAVLAEEAAQSFERICRLCPEVKRLLERIRAIV
jgi:hypothetical protein